MSVSNYQTQSTPLITIEPINHIGAIEGVGVPVAGKVRDSYLLGTQHRAIVTTDRVSAFDRVIGLIPNKGAMLNQLSAWWFEQLKQIVPNHYVDLPHPNVMLVRQAQTLPIEVVVRGYITGSTSTSLWTLYEQGQRHAYGISLPEGLKKNDALPTPIITPTTKAQLGLHDEPISGIAIVEQGILSQSVWNEIQSVALAIFKEGQRLADKAGLILVDTKYEFGLIDGRLALIDEVHTPDSSRYWNKASYIDNPASPISYDKEILRLWLAQHGYKGEGLIPVLNHEIINSLQNSYQHVVNTLMGDHYLQINHINQIADINRIHQEVCALHQQYNQ